MGITMLRVITAQRIITTEPITTAVDHNGFSSFHPKLTRTYSRANTKTSAVCFPVVRSVSVNVRLSDESTN